MIIKELHKTIAKTLSNLTNKIKVEQFSVFMSTTDKYCGKYRIIYENKPIFIINIETEINITKVCSEHFNISINFEHPNQILNDGSTNTLMYGVFITKITNAINYIISANKEIKKQFITDKKLNAQSNYDIIWIKINKNLSNKNRSNKNRSNKNRSNNNEPLLMSTSYTFDINGINGINDIDDVDDIDDVKINNYYLIRITAFGYILSKFTQTISPPFNMFHFDFFSQNMKTETETNTIIQTQRTTKYEENSVIKSGILTQDTTFNDIIIETYNKLLVLPELSYAKNTILNNIIYLFA